MKEKTLKSQRVFDGRLLQLDVLEVELDGGTLARREIVRHRGAVAVWARAPDGRFVFVRQFRKAIEQELLEVVAGTRDEGETPEACARRELEEETGYTAKMLTPLGFIFAAPGFCTEQIAVFYADLSSGGAAKPDPDEHLEVVLLDEAEWKAMIARGDVHDAKTWAAWGLFETRRSKIRGQRSEDGLKKTPNIQHRTPNVE